MDLHFLMSHLHRLVRVYAVPITMCGRCGTNRQELTAPAEISTKRSEQIKLSKALQTRVGVVWSGPTMFAISSVLFYHITAWLVEPNYFVFRTIRILAF